VAVEPQIIDVGREAIMVDLGTRDRAAAAYRAILALVERTAPRDVPRDVVPAATTVLVDGVADVDGWRRIVAGALVGLEGVEPDEPERDLRVVAVDYDGEDLQDVAAAWGCSVDEVVVRHTATTFAVAFCGFAPGFAYCTSEPPLPEVPRRATPRTRVPAGSVAMAGEFCGVYPREMPGGWQLIGTTTASMFDVRRDPPALLAPGDQVRFERR
jgi:KipI family sensor histidine kinase inhibitor